MRSVENMCNVSGALAAFEQVETAWSAWVNLRVQRLEDELLVDASNIAHCAPVIAISYWICKQSVRNRADGEARYMLLVVTKYDEDCVGGFATTDVSSRARVNRLKV